VLPDALRPRVAAAPVARLAMIDGAGLPTAVPICFAVDGDTLYSAVDDKPKRTQRLARLANVAAHPNVTVLVDHYDEDWTALWWARARGVGREVADAAEREQAVDLLRAKYVQYATHALSGPVLAVDVRAWTSWTATRPG